MTTLTPPRKKEAALHLVDIREEWMRDVTRLVHEVKTWAASQGWATSLSDADLSEEATSGSYTVPVLTIDAPQGRLVLEPIARGTFGAEGRIDLYAWPSLFRVLLLHKPPLWIVHTESGIDWPQAWNEKTFVAIANGLLNAS